MGTATRTPEFSQATIVKPFKGFESKYKELNVESNPIAIPGDLDPMAGKDGYDPNLLKGIPVPLGSKIFIWLPRFTPSRYGEAVQTNYRYKLVWRLRSLGDQTADPNNQLAAHFGRLLPGVPQEEATAADPPSLQAVSDELSGPRLVIPTAFESVQIVNNKDLIASIDGTQMPVQKGTDDASGVQIAPQTQEPAKVAVVSAETNTFLGNYQAPLSPNYPSGLAALDPKVAAAGLLSQGFYSDQAGWAQDPSPLNAGYPAGGQYVIYETEVKGDELILLLDRESTLADPDWDFEGADRNVSRIFGTDGGTRAEVPTLGVYILTGSGVGNGQSYG
jgi:hypothetical protein